MAGSSSSSGGLCNYDVFLSFRGEDTRKIFVGHLYRALEQKAINTFIDSEDLRKGNKISELLNAIEDSRISIVVLSENYASSSWCLKELVKILECMDTNNQIVLPIFYQVDPSHIRNLNGKFGQAFANKFGGGDKKELESWTSALTRVADLSGWDSTKYEDDGKLIEKIVENTFKNLIHISSSKATGLVGMDFHINSMRLRLCPGVNDVRVVGIWGMGGIGKTTIARAVYDEIASQFQHSCFLDNVKEAFKNKLEVQMQEKLLSELLKEKEKSVGLNRGRNMIMQRLGKKKILVVLDDVENCAQIEAVLGNPHSFGVGSRIIVTTRDKQSLSGVDGLYQPKHLSHDEANQLFMKYAFRQNQPTGEYTDLSRRAIHYAQGLPLALKVLGASLYNKTEREWTGVLEKLKKIPHRGIMDVLKTSIEGLDDSEKDTFLDIACFFRGEEKNIVTEVLDDCGFFPDTELSVLVDRALITILYDYWEDEIVMIDMHDLLQEMGREMVCQDPRGRSRLWSYEDVDYVLTQSRATEAVERIVLDLSNSKFDLWIDTWDFARMRKLRLLMVYYSFYSYYYDFLDFEDICPSEGCKQHGRGNFESLSHELRILLWHGCPLNSLPSNFKPINLVRLDMRGSRIQQLWEGIKHMKKLKVILLSYCKYLVKIPDLREAINLERLVLDGCSSLIEVHPSVLALQNLLTLSLKGCKELKIFPSSIHMKSLQTLDLSGCSNLDKFPEIAEVMEKLTELHLDGTAIKELPSSINNLTGLPVLDLRGCGEFKSLPSSIGMKSLRTLDLFGCSNFEEFPDILEEMEELRELNLGGTSIRELPLSINNLTGLLNLNLKDCRELKSLPNSIGMKSLWTLDLSRCSNLEEFPEVSEVMENLINLHLDETAIKKLPSSIERLQGLNSVSMRNCKSLVCLPDSICNLALLTFLDLSGCSKLSSLPENIGSLKFLRKLELWDSGIEHLAFAFSFMRQLGISLIHPHHVRHLDLSNCNLLELSESIAHLYSLESLKLCRNNFESLPATMNRLGRLRDLRLEACYRLKSIPELSSSIIYIDAHDCISLETVSMPKPQYHTNHVFTFSNCFQLQTNLFRDIVERHSHFQDNCLQPLRLKMSLPGAEVPDWFDHQSRGYSVSVQLPPNWFDSKFLGFAICAVRTRWESPVLATFICTLAGNFGECCFSFDLLDSVFKIDKLLWSDHMFLGYVPWSECPFIKEGRLVNETYTEATFQIVVVSGSITEQLCGVRLIYANPDEMLNLSTTRPQVHVNSCGTEVSLMDPCEMRNKETKRVKITEVSREVVSSEAGEGRDTCPEQQIERKGEKEIMEMMEQEEGEGCRMLRPVCCCLSSSGCNYCNMSLRKKETEREGDRITGVSGDGELSELGNHSGLPEPEPQSERKEEKELMGVSVMEEELAVGRGLLGPLCSCFYWLGALWR